MNKFWDVIAAVMRQGNSSAKGKGKGKGKEIHICVYYMRAMAKGCGLSWLKVDVSHVACQMDISRTAGYYPAVRCM